MVEEKEELLREVKKLKRKFRKIIGLRGNLRLLFRRGKQPSRIKADDIILQRKQKVKVNER